MIIHGKMFYQVIAHQCSVVSYHLLYSLSLFLQIVRMQHQKVEMKRELAQLLNWREKLPCTTAATRRPGMKDKSLWSSQRLYSDPGLLCNHIRIFHGNLKGTVCQVLRYRSLNMTTLYHRKRFRTANASQQLLNLTFLFPNNNLKFQFKKPSVQR